MGTRRTGPNRSECEAVVEPHVAPHTVRRDTLLSALELGADSLTELLRVERLGDVIVGAKLETLVNMIVRGSCGKENDPRPAGRRILPQPSEKLQPTELGHHHVEYTYVRSGRASQLERLDPVSGGQDSKPVPLESKTDEVEHVAVVVGDKNGLFQVLRHHAHAHRKPRARGQVARCLSGPPARRGAP
jgi:hypothetical protein